MLRTSQGQPSVCCTYRCHCCNCTDNPPYGGGYGPTNSILCCGMNLTGVDVFVMPEFEHQKSPDLIRMIPGPIGVRFAHPFDHVCIKIAPLPEPGTQQGIPNHPLKRS